MEEIIVSVYMLCYNHALYIRKAIDSILSQKTNFKYELIIHDDASTDASADIIREYERLYPHIIVPIYQIENKYSQGKNIVKNYIQPKIKGKYVAMCEGDDYWCDEYKLQKQIEFLENHEEFSATAHNCYIIDGEDRETNLRRNIYPLRKNHEFTLLNFAIGSLYPGQTASIVYRSNAMKFKLKEQEEDFYNLKSNGDTKRNLQLLLEGKIYYFSDIMSVHRVVINGGDSWSARNYKKNKSYTIFLASIEMRKYVRKYYHKIYYNYYTTFHSGVACVLKYVLKKNDENKQVFESIINYKNGKIKLFFYLLILFIPSIPLGFIYELTKKQYRIK